MATAAIRNLETGSIPQAKQVDGRPHELRSNVLLDVIETCFHQRPSEWIFFRELRVGTGLRTSAAQRLDAFALNCFAHQSMKRVCYEVKTSRADFLCETKHPLKRRIGLRYSNEFYFVIPAGMLQVSEIPIECGLIEIGAFDAEGRNSMSMQSETFAHFDVNHPVYCRVSVPAPWRETPGPTWQFVAGMLRNQQRVFGGRPPTQPNQQRLPFTD